MPLKKVVKVILEIDLMLLFILLGKNVAKLTFFRSNNPNNHTNEIRYDVISNPYCNIFPSTLCNKWVILYLLQNLRVQTWSYFNLMQDKLPSLRIHAFKVKDFQHTWKNTIVKGGARSKVDYIDYSQYRVTYSVKES